MIPVAEHDENDERDDTSSGGISEAGRVADPVTDPPTLPPFADGPRPATIHGFPKVDVFGSGDNVDDLFDVPTLGSKSSVGPAPKPPPKAAAPPPVAPLSGRKAPPTGPLPTLPPIGNAPAVREPTPGPRMHDVDAAGVPTELPDESPSTTLPPASSLIEKIRAAKRNAGAGDDAKPGPLPKLPPIKPLAASKKPVASKPVVAKPSEPEPSEPEPSEPEPSEPSKVAASPEPAPAAADVEPSVDADAAKPDDAETRAWLEPVPLDSLDRRPQLVVGTGTAAEPLPSSEATLRADTGADASSPESPPVAAAEPEPESASDDEQTIAVTPRPMAISSVVAPPPPSTGPLAPPPPPTTTGPDGDEPRVGAPYVPPAVVLRADETLDDELAEEADIGARAPELPRPARLPLPGARLPPADPIIAARLAQVAAEQPTSAPVGAPQMISPQDTASLVNGLASELIAEVESEQAVTLQVKVPVVASQPPRTDDRRRRKFALGALAAGMLLSILALVLPGGEGEDASLVPDIEQPQPEQPDPTLAARTDAKPQPEPEPVAPPTAEPDVEAEPEPQVEAPPEPEPEPKPEPAPNKPAPGPKRGKKSQSEPEPTPAAKQTDPKPAPKPDPKPSTSASDNRSADDLYSAAQSAYSNGRASEAYKLASDSYRKSSKSKTAELMTLAACKLKDAGKARSALAKVSAFKRNGIKKDCKAMGVNL